MGRFVRRGVLRDRLVLGVSEQHRDFARSVAARRFGVPALAGKGYHAEGLPSLMPMKSAQEFAVVLVTAPDLKTARLLAGAVLQARLAACVNVIPRIES